MRRFPLVVGLAVALVWGVGCGSGRPVGPPRAPVKGVVNMDGKAVPSGEVHFGVPGVPPTVCEIKGGSFSGEAVVGQNKVEVFIYADDKGADKGAEKYGGARGKVNTTPARYWGPNTTLAATVTDAGPNDFQFAITSR